MEKDWKLDIVFSDSVAIFRGHVGPNKPHSHWASQLTIALDGELEFAAGDAGRRHARALFLSSNVKHQLYTGYVCSIYVDPLARSPLTALCECGDAGWAALTAAQLPAPLRQLSADSDLRALLKSDLLAVTPPDTAEEGCFRDIVNVITAQLRAGNDPDREGLAQQVNLSPAAFRTGSWSSQACPSGATRNGSSCAWPWMHCWMAIIPWRRPCRRASVIYPT